MRDDRPLDVAVDIAVENNLKGTSMGARFLPWVGTSPFSTAWFYSLI